MIDDFEDMFARVRSFDWHHPKAEWNFRERQIDFKDARLVFDGPFSVLRSDRKGEVRYMVFGFLDNVEIVIVCTTRGETCWIISARRARRDERKKYHANLPQRPKSRPDQSR